MAYSNFNINFSLCQQNKCADILITDTSTGYGTDTEELPLDKIRSVFFELYTLNSGIYTSVDNYHEGGLDATILSQQQLKFLMENAIADGLYYAKYTVTTINDLPIPSGYVPYFCYCNVQCCIDNYIAGIADHYNCNDCDKNYISMVQEMYGLFISMKGLAARGNFSEATKILTTLQRMCNITNCNCK